MASNYWAVSVAYHSEHQPSKYFRDHDVVPGADAVVAMGVSAVCCAGATWFGFRVQTSRAVMKAISFQT